MHWIEGTTTERGMVIAIDSIGYSQDEMQEIEAKPKHPSGHEKHHGPELGDQPAA